MVLVYDLPDIKHRKAFDLVNLYSSVMVLSTQGIAES